MATINFSVASKSARSTALNTSIGTAAKIKIFTGSIPASPDSANTGTLLATFTGNTSSAFGAVSSGVLTLNNLTDSNNQVTAVATGTAGYARIETSGGTAVLDLDVGTSSASIILNTLSITSGGPIQLQTNGTITEA